MSTTQIHLALTHVPVILSFTGLFFLIGSYFIKNPFLTKVAFFTLAAAALFALPVYFTGESTEHAVENLPGISELIIEEHEDMAKIAMIVIMTTGLLALAGIFFAEIAERKAGGPFFGNVLRRQAAAVFYNEYLKIFVVLAA